MKTDFLGGFYMLRSRSVSAQSCINLYTELNESGVGDEGALIGTPGKITQIALPDKAEVRGMRPVQGCLYTVCGSSVYRCNPLGFGYQLLGTLPNYAGPVSITDNESQILFSHAAGWHYCTPTGSNLLPISNPDQPMSAIVTEQDEHVLFVDGTMGFAITALQDVTTTSALDFAAPIGAPDKVVSIISDKAEVWIPCQYTTEIWSNTGNALFPFERVPGGLLDVGCAAGHTVVALDDSLFWLAQDRGGISIIRTNAYKHLRISTQAIERVIEKYRRIDDATAFGYTQEGHAFYVINFPSANQTWAYDCATKLWHLRAWMDPATGLLHRDRANCYAFFNGQHLVGDYANGKVYSLDLGTYTENDGQPIYRERAFAIADAENKRIRVDKVELDGEMGGGNITGTDTLPILWLKVSHDDGRTFGYERYQTMGAVGRANTRCIWRRGGIGRGTVLKFATVATTKVAWKAVNIEAEVLS